MRRTTHTVGDGKACDVEAVAQGTGRSFLMVSDLSTCHHTTCATCSAWCAATTRAAHRVTPSNDGLKKCWVVHSVRLHLVRLVTQS
jgi:hypothetical protein